MGRCTERFGLYGIRLRSFGNGGCWLQCGRQRPLGCTSRRSWISYFRVVLAPNLWEETDEHGAVTVPELISQTTDDRFSKYAAALGGVFAIIFLLAYVAAQISAAGKSIESQFELSYITATSLTAGFVTAYAMLGGFRAVSWTDTVQALMMLFALVDRQWALARNQAARPALKSRAWRKGRARSAP